jgi:hypothetical protein
VTAFRFYIPGRLPAGRCPPARWLCNRLYLFSES